MTTRRKTTATVLAGAVVLASGAYAIGSQSGGGTSGAATGTASQSAGPGDPAASLASRLGVTEAQLRAAFDDIRKTDPPPGGDPRAKLEKALADALGIDQSKVADALDKLRTQHEADESARHAAFAKSLAQELGLDPAKVTAALEKLRPDRGGPHAFGPPPGGVVKRAPGPPPPGGPMGRAHGFRIGPPPGRDGFLPRLANELGVDSSKLRAALDKLRPVGPRRGPDAGGPPAGFADDLAKALGANSSDVQSALDKIHTQIESDMTARRDKLAAALADRLNLPVKKVEDALAAGPPGPPRGP
jgi:hypothetical protein